MILENIGGMKMKRLNILFIFISIFLVIVVIDSANLNRSTSLETSDLLVLLGGGDGGRVQLAVELYEADYADKVFITSVASSELDYNDLNIEYFGIPTSAIIYKGDAKSTYEDAESTFELMKDENFTSAIIVTSDYHMKRARTIFERLNQEDYTLYFSGAPDESGAWWYETEDWYKLWWSEFVKYWGYELRMYRFFLVESMLI